MAIVDELIAILGFDVRGQENVEKFNKTLDGVQRKASEVGRALGTMAAVAGGALATGFSVLGFQTLKTSAQFEKYLATLETIEGSAEGAKKAMDWVADFAKRTPYEVDELTRAFVKLRSYGLDPMDGSMTQMGDTAAGMGKSIDQVVEAVADASTFQFERLRELGIVASQAGDKVTFSWTENGESMTKTLNKTSKDVTNFLYETWGRKFGGAMERQSKTWDGMMSNIGDTWTDFQRRIGDAGFFDAIKDKLQSVVDLLARWDEDGTIDRIAETMSRAFTWAADAIGAVITQIGQHVKFLMENFDELEPYIKAVGIGLLMLAAWAFPVTAVFALIALALDDFLTYMEGGESIIGSFIEWIKALPGSLHEVAQAMIDALGNIDWEAMGRQAGTLFVDAIAAAIVGAASIATSLWDTFSNLDWGYLFDLYVAGMQAQVGLLYGFFTGVRDRVLEILKEAFNIDLVAIGQRMASELLQGLQSMGAAIRNWFASLIPSWAKDLFSGTGAPVPTAPQGYGGWSDPKNWPKNDNAAPSNVEQLSRKMGAPVATTNVLNDNKQSTQTTTVNAPVTVNVKEASQAPAAVGGAVAGAVKQAPARMQTGSAF